MATIEMSQRNSIPTIKKLGLEVLRLNDTLNQEKKIREDTHGNLRSMLAGMKSRLHGALEVSF